MLQNISSIVLNYDKQDVEFKPFFVLSDGSSSFTIDEIKESDYEILQSLEFEKIPKNYLYKILEILWKEKKQYEITELLINTYKDLFNEFFSDEEWYNTFEFIRRAISLSKQVKNDNLYNICCDIVYTNVIRIDGKSEDYLSIRLIEIIIEQKYGDLDIILNILENIILNINDYDKVESAYQLQKAIVLLQKGKKES